MQTKPSNWKASHEPTPRARIANASPTLLRIRNLDVKAVRRQACVQRQLIDYRE
jgi:hypothetical protein